MADLLFLKRGDGKIMKVEGDKIIHACVEMTRETYDHIQIVGDVYKRVSLIERDPCVRDRIMARLFLLPNHFLYQLAQITDDKFEIFIGDFRNYLSYLLFPATLMEFDRKVERILGSGGGGALLRALGHVPVDTFTYFERQWFRGSKF